MEEQVNRKEEAGVEEAKGIRKGGRTRGRRLMREEEGEEACWKMRKREEGKGTLEKERGGREKERGRKQSRRGHQGQRSGKESWGEVESPRWKEGNRGEGERGNGEYSKG